MAAEKERWHEPNVALERFKSEIMALVKKDLEDVGAVAPSASTIWHYTDVAGALAIIKSGNFWFTERAHLNDTVELQYGLRIGHEMFDTAVKQAGPNVPQSVAESFSGGNRNGHSLTRTLQTGLPTSASSTSFGRSGAKSWEDLTREPVTSKIEDKLNEAIAYWLYIKSKDEADDKAGLYRAAGTCANRSAR